MDSSGKINDLRIIDASKLTTDALVAVNNRHNACVENRSGSTQESGSIFSMDGIQVGSSLMQVPFTVNTPEGPITIHSVTNQQLQQNFTMAVPQAPPGNVQKMQVMNSTPNMPIITVIMPEQGTDSSNVTLPVVQSHLEKSKSKVFTRVACSVCDKTFSCGANLRDHMRLHTGEKPFKCSECPMEFAQRSNWRLHKRVHTGERPFMCGICGKTFARSSHLPGHVRMHTGERPFICELCNASFSSAQALKNHSRTHTGEKPYVCNSCKTPFTHSSSLSSHKKKCDGMKRRRGRPAGPGPKATRKKKEGIARPRGRPKKKLRLGRGRKKILPNLSPVDDIVDEAISSSQIDENDIAMEVSNDDEDSAANLETIDVSECRDKIEKPETTKVNTKVVRIPNENLIQRGSARLRHKRNKLLQELNHNEGQIILDNENSDVFEDHDLNLQNSNSEEPSIFIPNNDVGKNYILDTNGQSQPTIVTYVAPVNLATNSYVSEISQTYSNECSES